MSTRIRVAVTGLGVRAPGGASTPQALWEVLLAARPSTRRISSFDPTGLPVRVACEIPDFSPEGYLTPKQAARADRSSQLAVCAATDALRDAGGPAVPPPRRGVVTGTANGGQLTRERALLDTEDHLRGVPRPSYVPAYMPNAGAALISMAHEITGPSLCLSTACASGGHAVGEGAQLIRSGAADMVLAGGHEASVTPTTVLAFAKAGSLAAGFDDPAETSRPFDRDRRGFVLAEGAAFVVLERLDAARARGVRIYAELVGYGRNSDAHHLTAPHPDGAGAAACMRQALADAGLCPREVAHVNAHGTSTELNDLAEARALATVFGAGAVPVSATKSVTGHAIGAAGALEAVVSALSVHHGLAHPTANLRTLDPRCEVDVVTGSARKFTEGAVLSNTFGFGGHNACLVLDRAAR